MRLTMYGRAGCCLCDDMWEIVEQVGAERGLPISKVDVDRDPALAREYGDRVPVLFVDDRLAFKYRLTAGGLRAHLARRGG